MAWIESDDVADLIGVPHSDPRLAKAVAASQTWCQRQRSDLDPAETPPADVILACELYATFLFRSRTAPNGISSSDEFGQYDNADLMSNVFRLLGNRKPVAR